jgi:hypothetical protein
MFLLELIHEIINSQSYGNWVLNSVFNLLKISYNIKYGLPEVVSSLRFNRMKFCTFVCNQDISFHQNLGLNVFFSSSPQYLQQVFSILEIREYYWVHSRPHLLLHLLLHFLLPFHYLFLFQYQISHLQHYLKRVFSFLPL